MLSDDPCHPGEEQAPGVSGESRQALDGAGGQVGLSGNDPFPLCPCGQGCLGRPQVGSGDPWLDLFGFDGVLAALTEEESLWEAVVDMVVAFAALALPIASLLLMWWIYKAVLGTVNHLAALRAGVAELVRKLEDGKENPGAPPPG